MQTCQRQDQTVMYRTHRETSCRLFHKWSRKGTNFLGAPIHTEAQLQVGREALLLLSYCLTETQSTAMLENPLAIRRNTVGLTMCCGLLPLGPESKPAGRAKPKKRKEQTWKKLTRAWHLLFAANFRRKKHWGQIFSPTKNWYKQEQSLVWVFYDAVHMAE